MRRFNPWFEIPGLKITLPRCPLLKLRSPTFPRRLPALTGCLICPGPTRSRARAFPTSPASSAQIPPTTAPILKFQASKCSPRRHLSIAGLTLLIVARCRLSRKTTQVILHVNSYPWIPRPSRLPESCLRYSKDDYLHSLQTPPPHIFTTTRPILKPRSATSTSSHPLSDPMTHTVSSNHLPTQRVVVLGQFSALQTLPEDIRTVTVSQALPSLQRTEHLHSSPNPDNPHLLDDSTNPQDHTATTTHIHSLSTPEPSNLFANATLCCHQVHHIIQGTPTF
ncbi:hypothetical protein D9758_017337 [Tetrapyrgos nigripes]|uniref:Uncharacterized protein n=1 Tax=Tetrapyrgos nigripes TaxID=182062 RepID=A0A8H5C9P7_9AGAR|nr:hypothetical protein D9758_017337 [Tetrapyrgos nigripes]